MRRLTVDIRYCWCRELRPIQVLIWIMCFIRRYSHCIYITHMGNSIIRKKRSRKAVCIQYTLWILLISVDILHQQFSQISLYCTKNHAWIKTERIWYRKNMYICPNTKLSIALMKFSRDFCYQLVTSPY